MSALRQYMKNFIQSLNDLLTEHENDDLLVRAAKQRWGKNDDRYKFLLNCYLANRKRSVPDESGEDVGELKNEPVKRW